ncbi:MAG: zinc dependent phospholipase C family protein [Eubacteriales bacterium]
MVTKLHRHMGAMIRKNVIAFLPKEQSIRISPFWYELGNMLPDMCWLPVTHPHFEVRSVSYIRKKLDLSLNKHRRHELDQFIISPVFSLRLGIVSHYLCDFFCVAHQGSGINGARRHLDYEHAMRDYFYEHKAEIESLCRFTPVSSDKQGSPATSDSLLELFENWHEQYSISQSSFLRDFNAFQISAVEETAAFLTDIQTAIECCTYLFCAFAEPVPEPVAVACSID